MIHNKGKFIPQLAALVAMAAVPVPVAPQIAPQAPVILYEESAVNRNGNLGGRTDADGLCQASANRPAGYTSYRAFISVDADDEIRDMPDNYRVPTSVPIQSLNGTVIANDWADLLDGNIAVTLQAAGVLTNWLWWSGSWTDGSLVAGGGYDCDGWTSGSADLNGVTGYWDDTGQTWIAGYVVPCSNTSLTRVLCLAFDDGVITVVKDADPSDGADFTFSGGQAGRPPTDFWTLDDAIPDDGDGFTDSKTWTGLAPGAYVFTEDDPMVTPGGYRLTNLDCVETGTDNSVWNVVTRTATINLEAGEIVTCTFTNSRHYILRVNTVGGGGGAAARNAAAGWSGTVTSEPAGINCGADCTEYYLEDTVVTLTAGPGLKSYFIEWGGDCSGAETTVQVTLDDDKACTATFGYPVGGIVVPVDKLGLLAPWAGLAILAGGVVLGVVVVRRRRG